MAVVGLVFYLDDPARKVFRRVYLSPGDSEAEFDDPKHVRDGCDPHRQAALIRVEQSELHRYDLTGTP